MSHHRWLDVFRTAPTKWRNNEAEEMTTKLSKMVNKTRAIWLGRRTQKRWGQIEKVFRDNFGIALQAPRQEYVRFISSFEPKKIGPFTMRMNKTGSESLVMLAITKWVKRPIGTALKKESVLPKKLKNMQVSMPSNLFRMKFALTSGIEPELQLPIDRNVPAAVCAITAIQGPSDYKYKNPTEYVNQIKEITGEPWQNFFLREMISHAKKQGMQAVALLRPENNPYLTKEKLSTHGDKAENLGSIRSQIYAAARKTGFKKIPNSKYFWIFFGK